MPPADLPRGPSRRGRRAPGRGRVALVVALVVAFVLAVSLREIAGLYTDHLWFESLDLAHVWRSIVGTQVALIAFFTGLAFLLVWVNLGVADRLSARSLRPLGPGDDEIVARYQELVGHRSRLLRAGVAGLIGLVAGSGAASQWESWVLFRHRQDFGIHDATFDVDVGFYVFQLPFLRFVTGWLFSILVVVLVVTALVHYLNGGIRAHTPGDRVASPVKAHLSVLLAALALVRAGQYVLDRYELVYSTRGPVDGATYTDVNVQLRAIHLLVLIALFATGLFIANIWRRGWVLPVMAVGIWALVALLAGEAVPAFVQRFRVEPDKAALEQPYVENNIVATRAALGLDEVVGQEFAADRDLSGERLLAESEVISNIRLWDADRLQRSFENERTLPAFYAVPDVDFDRYLVGDQLRQVAVAPRQLDDDSIPEADADPESDGTSNWENERLVYTAGYDVRLAPTNAKTQSDEPDVVDSEDEEGGLYPQIDEQARSLYIGEDVSGYKIVDSAKEERAGEDGSVHYEGVDGIALDSTVRRAAFALRFGDVDPLISPSIRSDTRLLMHRDVVERVETLAPFLAWDHDPYAVIIGGRVVYVVDGYTTTDRFPNAESVPTGDLPGDSGLSGRSFNYVRNSVKAVVDAYDGVVTMYVTDGDDPLVRAYDAAFPELFTPESAASDALRDHFRYPEDLFRVQTTMWARYHVEDARAFLEGNDRWTVAPAPDTSDGASTSTTGSTPTSEVSRSSREEGVEPTYQLLDLPDGTDGLTYELVRSFTPPSRGQLTAFMTASPSGDLVTWTMPSGVSVYGPRAVAAQMDTSEEAGELRRLFGDEGSSLSFGNVLLVPVDEAILYVRSVYVTREGRPNIKAVMAAYQTKADDIEVSVQPSLALALEDLFDVSEVATLEEAGDRPGQFDDDGGDDPVAEGEGETPSTDDEEPGEDGPASDFDGTDDELVAALADAFDDADAALRAGDVAAWAAHVDRAESLARLLAARREAAEGEEAPPPTTTVPAGRSAPATTEPGA